MVSLNRMKVVPAPNSRSMRAYMQAVLEATGLLAGESFDMSVFMRNYQTHLQSGRLIRHADGRYSLITMGRQYFVSRLTNAPVRKGQLVSRAEVIEMLQGITADVPMEGWERIREK